MAKHVTFGGSTIARTIACPGWVGLSKDMPPGAESDAAMEGTLLHNCMEEWMMNDIDPMSMIGMTYKQAELTVELADAKLLPAVNVMDELMNIYDISEFVCEPYVELGDDVGGSIDFIGKSADEKSLLLVDYKFGYHEVQAEGNKQLLFYALCASLDPSTAYLFEGVEKVHLYIVQPTTEKGLTGWTIPAGTMTKFEQEMTTGIKEARAPDATLCSGSHCKFCPAMPICPEKTGEASRALRINPEDLKTISEALTLAEQLEPWIKAVKTIAHEQLELGESINGYKLVQKRATRKWGDEDAIMDMVRKAKKLKLDEACDIKLKSPAQLEKLCKKKKVDFSKYSDYIESVSTGTTLAKADDARPAVKFTANQLEELTKLDI